MSRKDTQGFNEVMKEGSRRGVQLRLKFPAAIFNKLLEIKKRLGLDELHDLYVIALEKYLEILKLVINGYHIFATARTGIEGIDLDPGTIAITGKVLIDKVKVVTEVTPRFSAAELSIYMQVEKIFKNTVKPEDIPDMSTIFVEAITIIVWRVDRNSAGESVKADKNPPQGVIRLPFDRKTLLIKRS